MKKLVYSKIVLLLFILFFNSFQGEAERKVYVTATGGETNGDGSPSTPVSFTRFQTILSEHTASVDMILNIYFKGGTYELSSPLAMTRSETGMRGLTITFNRMSESDEVIFKGNNNHQLINRNAPGNASSGNPFRITFKNIIFDGFSSTKTGNDEASATNCFVNIFEGHYTILTFDHVTIQNCHTNAHLFHVYSTGSKINMYNSSIINNNRGTNRDIINLRYTIPSSNTSYNFYYNNTFSNNTARYCINISTENGRNTKVFNNTFYNTGNIYLRGTELAYPTYFVNNIVAGSSAYAYIGPYMAVYRNTQPSGDQLYYNTSGNNAGVNITTEFKDQFDTKLTGWGPGAQVHLLKNIEDQHHVILNKGTLQSYISNPIGVVLSQDQLGNTRPSSPDICLSMGAIDTIRYVLSSDLIRVSMSYNSNKNILPSITTIDLADYIIGYPANTNSTNTIFSITDSSNTNGVFSMASGSSQLIFTPPANLENIGSEYRLTYKISNSSGNKAIGYVIIKLVDNALPPGYTDPKDYPQTCFDFMGAVNFTSRFTWSTDSVNGGASSTRDNGAPWHYGFSIPLVGDLDGDGYPEIIGARTGGNLGEAIYRGIAIYNGQTGELISDLLFPCISGNPSLNSADFFWSYGSHGSPSNMSLVDSDRDGTVELIIAFPYNGNSQYRKKLVSYNIEYNANTKKYSLVERWKSNEEYTTLNQSAIAESHTKGIPQIVDLDGDGNAEVVIYNRIYDAQNGKLLLTIEPNGTPYVGADRGAFNDSGDRPVNFSYVYDLDLDGIYDIVAGGKMYKITKNSFGDFEYTIFQVPNVPDGRTGVADINGDGIPDIVVVTRAGLSNPASNIRIVVWNPGLHQMDSFTPTGKPIIMNGEFLKNPSGNPYIMADITFTFSRDGGSGSNSYVYIGDIDGREQSVTEGSETKKYRLPEIAVLSRQYGYNSIPLHPNIQNDTDSPITGTRSMGTWGEIVAVTWDANPNVTDASQKLKLSFVLEHYDTSNNTGFTLFDFDNDGMQEIVYRDESTIRIIKAKVPFVKLSYTEINRPDVILFKENVRSYTGFEYPVIVDVNNDASAEIVVLGHTHTGATGTYYGYIYTVGYGSQDKFAPALPVWNQFMYSPFKINPDLTTPIGPAKNVLSYEFKHEIKGENGDIVKIIDNYKPYNNTLGQIPYYTTLENGPGEFESFEPIIFLTDASIAAETAVKSERPKITINEEDGKSYIEITIANKETAKTDISINTPISIYNGIISKDAFVKKINLADAFLAYTSTKITSAIKAGESIRIWIPITDPFSMYYVRLADNSGYDGSNWVWRFGTNNGTGLPGDETNPPEDNREGYGIGIASRPNRDCNWTDQSVKVSLVGLNADAVTVQEYSSILINLFNNDDINIDDPSNPFETQKPGFQMSNQYIRGNGPVAGTLSFSGNNIIYTHNGTIPPNNIDTFSYAFNYSPTGSGNVVRHFYANVYVYILQAESDGFGACYGDTYSTKLKESPMGIRFHWWDEGGNFLSTPTTDSLTIDFGSVTISKTYTVKPLLTLWNNERIEFIPGNLTVNPIGADSENAQMKWTGAVSRDWHDPRNWVEVKGSSEQPVMFIPSSCVDVTIPSGLTNYPEMSKDAACHYITLEDCAMIAGIDWLSYDSAAVNIKLTPTEKDRFIMWSAPLKDMYSGDYHYKKANSDDPQWGDVYMNLFQHESPAGATAKADKITATFGELGLKLDLGLAFNVRVTSTTENRDKIMSFPQIDRTSYTDLNDNNYNNLSRDNAKKFITDGKTGIYDLPVKNYVNNATLIQVVNPYMAYLDMTEFINYNSSSGLTGNNYAIWDGHVDNSVVSLLNILDEGNRYSVSTSPSISGGFIPPLQSFFVNTGNSLNTTNPTVKMSSVWTTTVGDGSPYQLRSASNTEKNILRIKAAQGNKTSYSVIHNMASATSDFNVKEDMRKIFYDEIGLEVYTLTPNNDALAINSTSNFSGTIPLGLRLRDAGEITLSFEKVTGFNQDAYLTDKETGKEINLQTSPSYTFTAAKSNDGKAIELNDRFTLRFSYNPTDNEEIELGGDDMIVSSKDGYIVIESKDDISSLQIYNISGALVYNSTKLSINYRVRVDRQQTYIVKAKIGNEYKVEKVFAR